MLNRLGKQTIVFKNKPRVISHYSVVGPKEGNGNFGKFFHKILKDDLFGEKSYEAAESKMLMLAITEAIKVSGIPTDEIDALFAGDLMNQITSSSFAARSLKLPYLGLFGACSTMAESLIMGACHVDGGFARYAACATGSHFSSAEKQFRYPLELGTQRPPCSQWTVTGTGCTILGNADMGITVDSATIGKVVDWNVTDANNMGAAMAPAAADTLKAHLEDTGRKLADYDLILTGDLGKLGSEILIDLMEYNGYHLGTNYNDCGQMIFSNTQKTFMGGSGCGCGASILNSYVFDRMEEHKLNNVLFIATGALMSSLSSQQGNSIPSIAHAVSFNIGGK